MVIEYVGSDNWKFVEACVIWLWQPNFGYLNEYSVVTTETFGSHKEYSPVLTYVEKNGFEKVMPKISFLMALMRVGLEPLFRTSTLWLTAPRKQIRGWQPNLLPIEWFDFGNQMFLLWPHNIRWGNQYSVVAVKFLMHRKMFSYYYQNIRLPRPIHSIGDEYGCHHRFWFLFF